ncbi:MAG: site-2 protease family protein [Alphaproteobacteria bacterium]|nr:site-2 protease family protein [Alphaproteobacteria bacterium]
MTEKLWELSTFIIPLFMAIILHEIAHGWVAYKLGDDTAKRAGRLTLNPIPHIDPIGSILVPAVLFFSNTGLMFGWARPVPVRFSRLKDQKRDMGLVALAGPLANFLLAIITFFVFKGIMQFDQSNLLVKWFFDSLRVFFMINIALCAFNLFPILPLDGGRILVSILPEKLSNEYAETEKYGFYILMILLFLLPMMGIDVIHSYMKWMATGLIELIDVFL